jgi:hypothetical protein
MDGAQMSRYADAGRFNDEVEMVNAYLIMFRGPFIQSTDLAEM